MPSLLFQFKLLNVSSAAKQALSPASHHFPSSTVIEMATEWPSDLWVHMNVIVMFVVSTLDAT
jgi:hypothetical protein